MAEKATEEKLNIRKIITRLIAVIALPLLLYVPVHYLQHYLCIPVKTDQTRILQFEKEPNDTIDVVMLGSSPTYSGFSSAYAYDRYGFTSYPYAVSGASCTMWKPAVMNILRTQKPKLVVVDVFGGGYDLETVLNRKAAIYMISEVMPMSPRKIEMALEAGRNVDSGDAISITFPIIRYHTNMATNYKEIDERIAIEKYGPSPMKGIETITEIDRQRTMPKEALTEEKIPLDGQTEDIICSFIDYCNSNGVDLLFIKYPCVAKYEEDFDAIKRQNSVMELADKKGCATLDLQERFHDIGLDEKVDFYDRSHTNIIGEQKLTDYIASYIRDTMGVKPSELDDSAREEWDEAVVYYNALCALAKEKIEKGKVSSLAESPDLVEEVEEYMRDHP